MFFLPHHQRSFVPWCFSNFTQTCILIKSVFLILRCNNLFVCHPIALAIYWEYIEVRDQTLPYPCHQGPAHHEVGPHREGRKVSMKGETWTVKIALWDPIDPLLPLLNYGIYTGFLKLQLAFIDMYLRSIFKFSNTLLKKTGQINKPIYTMSEHLKISFIPIVIFLAACKLTSFKSHNEVLFEPNLPNLFILIASRIFNIIKNAQKLQLVLLRLV